MTFFVLKTEPDRDILISAENRKYALYSEEETAAGGN